MCYLESKDLGLVGHPLHEEKAQLEIIVQTEIWLLKKKNNKKKVTKIF